MGTIGTLTLNPSVDQHLTVAKFVKEDAIRAESAAWFAGGKGINVTRVVHELGGRGRAFGFVGGFPGKMLIGWLDKAGIPHSFLEIAGDTRINTTVTDLSDNSQTHIRLKGPSITLEDLKRLSSQLLMLDNPPAFWVLGGSLPPGVPDDFYKHLIQDLEATGAKCVLDTDDEALTAGLDATPFMIKPNEHEFERLTGQPVDSDAKIVEAARKIVHKGTSVVLVSLGPRGAVVVTSDDAFRVNTPTVEVKSKVGAGDSTVAGTLVALNKGWALREAVRYGVAAGTAAVMSGGTNLCERENVEKIFPRIEIEPL